MTEEILLRAWMKKKFSLPNASYDIFTLKELMSGKNDFYKYENWGRYTGLKDKNGTMIFEGDILRGKSFNKDKGYKTIVEYKDGAFIVDACSGDYDATSIGFAIEDGFEFEVIGNIYENKIK